MCRWRYGKRHRHWWHTTSVRWVHIIAVVARQSHPPTAANLTNTRRRNDGGIIVRTMTRKTTARTVTIWCSGACCGAEIAKLCDRSHSATWCADHNCRLSIRMAVWLRELTEFRWTGSGARSVQWQDVAYWLVAMGYSCHRIQVLCETSHWTTVCSLCRYGPVWRTLSVCTDTACLPTSHNSPMCPIRWGTWSNCSRVLYWGQVIIDILMVYTGTTGGSRNVCSHTSDVYKWKTDTTLYG